MTPFQPPKARAITAFVACLCFVQAGVAHVNEKKVTEEDARKAFKMLKAENVIVSRYRTGWQETAPYEAAWAFTVIVRAPGDVAEHFERLADTGSYYGLIGLFNTDRKRYEIAKGRFKGATFVFLISADSIGSFRREEFINEIIPKFGKKVFDMLLFEELPSWYDTVTITDGQRARLEANAGNFPPAKP